MVERLVYADSPSQDDTSNVQQIVDVTVKINGLLKSGVEEIVNPLPCVHLEKPPQLEKVPLPSIQTTAFAAVSAASKLVKAGWDASR
jgi:hypothetical protein